MAFRKAKVYFDGSHYIAIPQENFIRKKSRRPTKKLNPYKAQFEQAYKDSQALPKAERKEHIQKTLQQEITDKAELEQYVTENIQRKKVNEIVRKVRLFRKLRLQEWNYFCTFTYDEKLHTEDTFKSKLQNTLKHLVARKGWKYVGVWERSTKERLHFHGIFYIPFHDRHSYRTERLQH